VLGSSHLAGPERRDLWVSSPVAGEGDLLAGTLNELGAWSNGSPASLDVTIGFESASVEWVLRHFPNISHGMVFAPGELPSAIVTDTVNQNFQIASAYRGQGLTWGVNVGWDHMTGSDWLRWLLFREAPSTNEQIVIWARADLFLAGGEVAIDDLTGEGVPETPPEEIIPLEDVEDVLPDG
jgi:hypothetical protein